jgi:hypothetical protein
LSFLLLLLKSRSIIKFTLHEELPLVLLLLVVVLRTSIGTMTMNVKNNKNNVPNSYVVAVVVVTPRLRCWKQWRFLAAPYIVPSKIAAQDILALILVVLIIPLWPVRRKKTNTTPVI